MRRGIGQLGRIMLGAAVLAGAAGVGGCAMTPRDEFFQARAMTFSATPGSAGAGGSDLAAGNRSTDLASAFGATR